MDPSKYSMKQRRFARRGALDSERSTWIPRYREVTEYLLPFSGRYFSQDRNRGDRSFNSILDSSATYALDVLGAGMMAGMTSPARPWFRLAVTDNDLMELDSVKQWLSDVEQLMRDIFARGNTYRSLHSMYEELGAFATACNIVDPNFDHVVWHNPLTAGEYMIGVNDYGKVDTVYRESEMTVAQIVQKFGRINPKSGSIDWSNISDGVKQAWDSGKAFDQWRPVLHVIEPRAFADREYGSPLSKHMRYTSCYYEINGDADDKVLEEAGYRDIPIMAPRWHTRGSDVYGHGPSMRALGDIKQLQHEQLRKGQGIDFQTQPPLLLPGQMKGRSVDTLPGGVNYMNGAQGASGARGHNLFDVTLDLQHLVLDIGDVRQRINRAFYADLFLMISQDPRNTPPTAREVAERHEEKLLMLGPVLERLHDEMLGPLIDITFFRMVEAKLLPSPPPEMQGMDLQVQFVSTLAQAQRAVGLASLDRLIATVGAIYQQKQDPAVWDKLDTDQIIDKYADMLAVDPSVIVADDQVAFLRADRQKQQAAMQAAATVPAMAGAASDLANVKTDEPNMATDIMQQLTGYTGV